MKGFYIILILLVVSCNKPETIDIRLSEFVEEFDIGDYEGFLFIFLDECPVCYNEFSNLSPFLDKYKISPVAISRSKVKLNNFGSNFKTCSYDSNLRSFDFDLIKSMPVFYRLKDGGYDSIPVWDVRELYKLYNDEYAH